MMKYLILQHPGHNRVYYNAAAKMALAELHLACQHFSVACTNIDIQELEGIRYLGFDASEKLSDVDHAILSRLSFVFAIFQSDQKDGNPCLIPIAKTHFESIDSKISSILKYQGKTNELFTKMMVNVALMSSDFDFEDKVTLLDPISGKGTTLFEAAVLGFDAYGIEMEPKSVHEATVFFKKFLQTERIKHKATTRQIAGQSKAEAINIDEFEFGASKEALKSGSSAMKLGVVCGNTQDAFQYFKKDQFNIIVGDLPYGIVHGNKGDKRKASITRNPTDLLTDSLAGWHKVLKPGGAVVIAWNSFLAHRKKLSAIFEEAGFEVCSSAPYDAFEHMVDHSIKRDIVVAKKIS